MVQKAAHVLYRLTSLSPEFRCGMAEDVDAGASQASLVEVPLKVPVEGPARKTDCCLAARPDGLGRGHRFHALAPSTQCFQDGI